MKLITRPNLYALIGFTAVSIFVAVSIGFGRLLAASGIFSCVPSDGNSCLDSYAGPDSIGGYFFWGLAVWVGLIVLAAAVGFCYAVCYDVGEFLVDLFAEFRTKGQRDVER